MKIALVLKTDGLEYDDRIRKEILSIQRLYPSIKFKIFAMLPENKEVEGVTDYGVPYKSIYIPARDKYASAERTLTKGYQFWKAVRKDLKEYDAVWTADCETMFITLLVRTKCLIWDLHELPTSLLSHRIKRGILKYAFSRCKVVIHANNQRREYLKSLGVVPNPDRHFVLSNYPEIHNEEIKMGEKYQEFKKWANNKKCVYLQGLNDDGRAAYETIAAILNIENLNAVVVGPFHKDSMGRLQEEFGDAVNERVFFVGRIPQMQITNYMKECFISAVFYKNTRANNYYCDANRFYLAVSQGLPVVVGENPSMRELINKYQFGLSIDTDGTDYHKIMEGLKELIMDYDFYKANVEKSKDKITWESQDDTIKDIIYGIKENL